MKDGQLAWCIERTDQGLRYLTWRIDYDVQGIDWSDSIEIALKFADRESAERMAVEMPDYWDVRICEHMWTDGVAR